MKKLTLEDILDLRQYERIREDFRNEIIALKRLRRVSVGPLVSVVFENKKTIQFQIQEMARAEKMMTDDGITNELNIYNALLPPDGWLSATVFLELVSKEELVNWLPKLVGIEKSVSLEIQNASGSQVVPGVPEQDHEKNLTREEVTASVHYILFDLSNISKETFSNSAIKLSINHENYSYKSLLGEQTKASLAADL